MHALLSPRLKLWIHLVEICLILPIIILTLVRVSMGMSFSGGGRMGLAFGAKSLIFIAYQLLTEHVKSFKRWKSLKAYAIINGLEIVFWVAVVYLVAAANIQTTCTGTVCLLGWVSVVLAVFMTFLSTWVFLICYFAFKQYRANGNKYPEECVLPENTKEMSTAADMHSLPSSRAPTQPRTSYMREQSNIRYPPGNYGFQYPTEEYHSSYAKTPTSMV